MRTMSRALGWPLGGGVFLMREVPLGIVLLRQLSEDGLQRLRAGHDAWGLGFRV